MAEVLGKDELVAAVSKHDAGLKEALDDLHEAQMHLVAGDDLVNRLARRDAAAARAEGAAMRTALELTKDKELDPLTRAVTSLTYAQSTLVWEPPKDNRHIDVTLQRLAVVNEILDHSNSGEPMLFIDGGYDGDEADMIAATLAVDSLQFALPTRGSLHPTNRLLVSNGFVGLFLDNATIAIEDRDRIVSIRRDQQPRIHIAGLADTPYSIDPLTGQLLRGHLFAGKEAIRTGMVATRPSEQLVAATALSTVGLKGLVEVEATHSKLIEQRLVFAIASMGRSSGVPVEGNIPFSHVYSLSKHDFLNIADGIGFSQDEIRSRALEILRNENEPAAPEVKAKLEAILGEIFAES